MQFSWYVIMNHPEQYELNKINLYINQTYKSSLI